MKGKRVIAGILLVGILAVTLAGCKNTDENKKETGKKRFFPVSVCRKSPAAAGLFLQAENTLCILKGFDAV